jgi:hypothetical protein
MPEGGFSRDEIHEAKEVGFISVSLEKQIFKVEGNSSNSNNFNNLIRKRHLW